MAIETKHLGMVRAICDGRKRAMFRTDLGVERYRRLGRTELLRGQEPYRICRACIKALDTMWKDRAQRRRRAATIA